MRSNLRGFGKGTLDVFNVQKILFDSDMFLFFRASASDVIVLNCISDELRGWRRYVLETGKLIFWVQRIGGITGRLELNTLGLRALNVVVRQVILCFVKCEVKLAGP